MHGQTLKKKATNIFYIVSTNRSRNTRQLKSEALIKASKWRRRLNILYQNTFFIKSH